MSAGSGAAAAPESTELFTESHFHYFVIVIMVDKSLVRGRVRLRSLWLLPPLMLLLVWVYYCVSLLLCVIL